MNTKSIRAYQNYHQTLERLKKEQEKKQKFDTEVQKRLEEKGLILFPSNGVKSSS